MTQYFIYGTQTCGYCKQAKTVLENKNLPYKYIDLTEIDGTEQARLMELAGVRFRTVPQIFSGESEPVDYIGGYTDLQKSLA
jgi:glutaredoxin